MQHTLVAVFDSRTDAQNAMNELLSSGYSKGEVRLSNADPTGQTNSATGESDIAGDRDLAHDRAGDSSKLGITASIKHFFSDLFGSDNPDHVSRYEGAVTRGHHVLTVTADSLAEVERAADIVERYGPTDIDEQASEFGEVPSGAAAMRMGAGSAMQSAPMSAQSAQPAGAAPTLENAGDRKIFQQQSLNQAEPMGTTYQEPMGKSGLTATGGTSLQGTTLRENSVQASSLDGTQQTGVGVESSGNQGGTLRGPTGRSGALQSGSLQGSSLEGSIQGGAIEPSLREDYQQGGTAAAQPGSQQFDTTGSASALGAASAATGKAAIPVVEEQLSVGKREVQRGGVRIFSRVVETPVNESIGLREEHVKVERHAVDRPLGDADAAAFREQSIEMRETAEEAVVQKSARIVEEVTVGKQVNERQERIQDTVRHTEVDVQRLGGDEDSYYRHHFASNFGGTGASYDDYAPAYSYGSTMRRDSRYANRQWDDVETDLRSDWESRNAGRAGSTWEKMKAAVRHGWERMTGDDDQDYYRNHFASNYADTGKTYDDYAPAYAYGSEMARSQIYRNRPWDEAMPSLRSDWETRSAGTTGGTAGTSAGSAWEDMKDAVRHGWNRMTGGLSDDDDNYYRNHYTSTYGSSGESYDSYRPAYEYGSAMHRQPQYSNRAWDDELENELRSGWQSRYPGGQSTWDKVREAVRHGWNRLTY